MFLSDVLGWIRRAQLFPTAASRWRCSSFPLQTHFWLRPSLLCWGNFCSTDKIVQRVGVLMEVETSTGELRMMGHNFSPIEA